MRVLSTHTQNAGSELGWTIDTHMVYMFPHTLCSTGQVTHRLHMVCKPSWSQHSFHHYWKYDISVLHSAPSGGRVGTPTRAGEATVKPAQEAEGLWPEEGQLATGEGREGNWSVLLDSTCKQNKHLIPLWDDMNSCCRRTERSLK